MSQRKSITSIILFLVVNGLAIGALAQGERTLPAAPGATEGDIYLDSSRFQERLHSETVVDPLATQQVALGDQAVAFGFAAKSTEAKFFILGSLYTEAVAQLHSGNVTEATKRLEVLEQELVKLQVPSGLYNYLSKTRNILERQQYHPEVLVDFLALGQPLLEDYAKSKGDDKLTLFRAGTWLMDIGLAAAAKDALVLRQSRQAQYFSRELKRLDAPKGVLEALDQLVRLTAKPQLTDADAQEVLTLMKQIQALLA